jgi:F-type H+-transporting ATPase subunit a
MFNALEQFEVFMLFCKNSYITNSMFSLFLVFLLFLIVYFLLSKQYIIPNRFQIFFEKIYFFIIELIKENLGGSKLYFFNLIYSIFFFILSLNLLGMIPYTFTVTSHLIVTFSFALGLFVYINFLGFLKNGLTFFGLFLPGGSPLALSPFLVIIELISYIARVFSLSIRLFANLMAGHTLLKILAEFG